MTRLNYSLSLLMFLEGRTWVAQCLEYDIVAQGKTLDEATLAFERTFIGQIVVDVHHGKQPLEGIGQAAREVWDKFNEKGKRLDERKPFYMPKGIPASYMIAAAAEDVRIFA